MIVGLQALVWLTLGLCLAVPDADLHGLKAFLQEIEDWAALVTVCVLAAAYSVGVVVDRVADSVLGGIARALGKVGNRLRRKEWLVELAKWLHLERGDKDERSGDEKVHPNFGEMRLRVQMRGGESAAFLQYVRSRLRIARATALNTVMIVLFAALASSSWRPTVLIVGVPAAAAALYAAWRIEKTYSKRLREAYKLVEEEEKASSSRGGSGAR